MEYRRFGNTIIARIDRGEEVLEQVKAIAQAEQIKLASVQALGAVGEFTVGVFHTAEKLYGELGFQGFRAQVVTYSIARLSYALQRRLPWEEMWETQRVPENVIQGMKVTLIGVRDVVIAPPPKWRNVTEWCKRDDSWEQVRVIDLPQPQSRLPELFD